EQGRAELDGVGGAPLLLERVEHPGAELEGGAELAAGAEFLQRLAVAVDVAGVGGGLVPGRFQGFEILGSNEREVVLHDQAGDPSVRKKRAEEHSQSRASRKGRTGKSSGHARGPDPLSPPAG